MDFSIPTGRCVGMEIGKVPRTGCLQLLIVFISTPCLSSAYLYSCEDVLSKVLRVSISEHVPLYIYIAPRRIRLAMGDIAWGCFGASTVVLG